MNFRWRDTDLGQEAELPNGHVAVATNHPPGLMVTIYAVDEIGVRRSVDHFFADDLADADMQLVVVRHRLA